MDACRKIIKIWIHAEYHTRPEMQVEDFGNPTRISSRAWVALHLRTESIKSSLRQLETRPDLPSWGSRECRAQQRCTRCRPPGTPPPLHTPPCGPRIRHRPAHKRTTNACVHASFKNIQTTRVYILRAVQIRFTHLHGRHTSSQSPQESSGNAAWQSAAAVTHSS